MTNQIVRFGVRSASALRSESWKCWTDPKGNVYIVCRRIREIKLSLHESGQWQVGWVGHPDELFEIGSRPKSRHSVISQRPCNDLANVTLACRIHIPHFAVNVADDNLDPSVVWVSAPTNGKAIEFLIFMATYPHYHISWPGKITLGSKLLGHLSLPSDGTLYIVSCERPVIDLPAVKSIVPNYMKGRIEDEFIDANRALLWGPANDGSILFCETPVAVTKPKAD